MARLQNCGAVSDLTELAIRCMDPCKEKRPADASEVALAVAEYDSAVNQRKKQERLDSERLKLSVVESRRRLTLWAALAATAAAAAVFALVAFLPPTDDGDINIAACPYVGSAPFKVIEELGLCKGYRVKVALVDLFKDARDGLLQGEYQAATCSLDGLVLNNGNGKFSKGALAVVLKMDESDGADGIVVRDPIEKMANLIGKRIALPKLEAPFYMFLEFLTEEGLALSQFAPGLIHKDSAREAYDEFDNPATDAVATYEPFLSLAKAKAKPTGGSVFKTSKALRVKIVDVLVVDSRFLRQHPKKVEALIRAWYEALDLLKKNDPKAREIAYKFLGEPAKPEEDKPAVPLTAAKYQEQAASLKLASVEENRTFFSRKEASKFHDSLNHVQKVFERHDQTLFGLDPTTVDGSDIILEMIRKGTIR